MAAALHIPVLASAIVKQLNPALAGWVLDATFGAGGHAAAILEHAPACKVVGVDRDLTAVAHGQLVANEYNERLWVLHSRFSELKRRVKLNPTSASGPTWLKPDVLSLPTSGFSAMLFDLGVSSTQLDNGPRGFAFRLDGPLDMRMDQDDRSCMTAADVVNSKNEHELADIIYKYGEERQSRRIASAIVRARNRSAIKTTGELARIVESVVGFHKSKGSIHPATKTFQALRIFINDELRELQTGLSDAEALLQPNGILMVLSYHSLEDRIVKQFLAGDKSSDREVEPPFVPAATTIIRPSEEEMKNNPRSRSAKLRVAIKK